MAEAHAKPQHDYHLVDPSPWPLVGAIAAFIMAVGLVLTMKSLTLAGLQDRPLRLRRRRPRRPLHHAELVADVIREASYEGHHTRVVQISHRYGMIMFIASEVMFFVAWFWAFFDASLYPNDPIQFSAHRAHRRALAAEGHRDLRPLAPAAPQHPHPADLRARR